MTNVSTSIPSDLPGCDAPADTRIEIYSPRDGHAHGSLDASLYVCAEHLDTAREAIHANGLTAYADRTSWLRDANRCGSTYDYTSQQPPAGVSNQGHVLSRTLDGVKGLTAAVDPTAMIGKGTQTLPTLDAPIIAKAVAVGREVERVVANHRSQGGSSIEVDQAWIDRAVTGADGDPARAYCMGFVDGLNTQLDAPEVQR